MSNSWEQKCPLPKNKATHFLHESHDNSVPTAWLSSGACIFGEQLLYFMSFSTLLCDFYAKRKCTLLKTNNKVMS